MHLSNLSNWRWTDFLNPLKKNGFQKDCANWNIPFFTWNIETPQLQRSLCLRWLKQTYIHFYSISKRRHVMVTSRNYIQSCWHEMTFLSPQFPSDDVDPFSYSIIHKPLNETQHFQRWIKSWLFNLSEKTWPVEMLFCAEEPASKKPARRQITSQNLK